MMLSFSKEKKFLMILFIFSFLVRALVFYCYLGNDKNYWQVDSNTYNLVAIQVAKGEGITNPDGSPHFYRLPGYPIFLSLWYKVFGVDTKNVLWSQIILASFIPILVFAVSLSLFPQQMLLAKVAGVCSAIHLGLVLYSGFFMTESLFILFFLLFLFLFFKSFHFFFCSQLQSIHLNKVKFPPTFALLLPEDESNGPEFIALYEKMFGEDIKKMVLSSDEQFSADYEWLLWAGLFLGIASMMRPVGHYLLVVACLMLLFSQGTMGDKVAKGTVLLWGWLMPVSFWLIRNFMLTGHLFFHTLPGGHFLYLSAARVAMHEHHTSYEDARKILRLEVEQLSAHQEAVLGRKLLEIESCSVHEKIAVKYFKLRPWRALQNWVTDMARTTFSLYSSELLYLDSGRKNINYFEKGRSCWSMVERYIFPKTENIFFKFMIWFEIIVYFLMQLGVAGGLGMALLGAYKGINFEGLCSVFKTIPFMTLFIVISLSGGYARMRLPIEPLMMILSLSFWIPCIKKLARSVK